MLKHSNLKDFLDESANQVRLLSRQSNKDLWVAFEIIGNYISNLIDIGSKEPDINNLSESRSNRISLTANLIQSYSTVEDLISSGAYWSAAAVLRQHMESLARILENRIGKINNDKKPPNVKILPFTLSHNYGRLSELCHVSGGEVLGEFSRCSEGEGVASTIPEFREEWASSFFSLHIIHMLSLAIELNILQRELHPELTLPEIDKVVLPVAKILVDRGFWKELG